MRKHYGKEFKAKVALEADTGGAPYEAFL